MAYICHYCNVTFDRVGQLARHYRVHKAKGLPTREEEVAKLLGEGKPVKEIRAMGFSARSISVARKLLARPAPPEEEITRLKGIVDRIATLKEHVTRIHSEAEEVLTFLSGIGAEEERIKGLEVELAQVRKAAESEARKILEAGPAVSKRSKRQRTKRVSKTA